MGKNNKNKMEEIEVKKEADLEVEKTRHKDKLIEIKLERMAKLEVEKIKFQHELEIQRIRSAEIKKSIDRKKDRAFMEEHKYGS